MTDWTWLDSTRALQREAYGFDVDALHDDPRLQAQSIRENVLPLIVEAVELLNNVSWKYWAHDEPFINRAEVLKEAVDIGHFLANILLTANLTEAEYWEAYRDKQSINRARQTDGYRVKEKP